MDGQVSASPPLASVAAAFAGRDAPSAAVNGAGAAKVPAFLNKLFRCVSKGGGGVSRLFGSFQGRLRWWTFLGAA